MTGTRPQGLLNVEGCFRGFLGVLEGFRGFFGGFLEGFKRVLEGFYIGCWTSEGRTVWILCFSSFCSAQLLHVSNIRPEP